jgi:hypothetical protein
MGAISQRIALQPARVAATFHNDALEEPIEKQMVMRREEKDPWRRLEQLSGLL